MEFAHKKVGKLYIINKLGTSPGYQELYWSKSLLVASKISFMKSTLLVPFGLKEDKLYEPVQVLNGKACGCVCPACKMPLVAKQNAATPHFAHAQDENCSKGLETAVHLAVKQIIAEKKQVRLPVMTWKNPLPRKDEAKLLHKQQLIQLESVVLEQQVDNFKPDIVVISGNSTYFIEVAVTHFVDEEKLQKIISRKIPTFEIDVSRLKNGFTLAELESVLFESKSYPAEWTYHPSIEELNIEAKKSEEDRIAKIREGEQDRKRKFEQYKKLKPEEKLKINLKNIGLTKQQMNELSVFVAWEDSFGVPRIVWQSAVLAYIAKVQDEQGWEEWLPCSVNSSACSHWLEKVFEIKAKVQDGEKIALWKYFKHLEQLEILKLLSRNDFDIVVGKQGWAELKTKQV